MKVKVSDLYISATAPKGLESVLSKVFNAEQESAKIAYSLIRTKKKIDEELENIDESRKKLLKKHCELEEDGSFKIKDNLLIFKENGMVDFSKEWSKFLDTKIDIDLWKVPVEALDSAKLSVNEMSQIEYLIEEAKEEANGKVKKA